MIRLRDFNLFDRDIKSLTPQLSNIDYYFIITLWPVNIKEKGEILKTVENSGNYELVFAEPVDKFDLCNIGFHYKHAMTTDIIEQLSQFRDLLSKFPDFIRDKQIAGQDIGIYVHDFSESKTSATDILTEIGKIVAYTINSNQYGNLSYPAEGLEMAHVLSDEKHEETLSIPATHMSLNEIIYEFFQNDHSKVRLLDAINALTSQWNTPCQIHETPDRDACVAEFWLERGTVANVGRYDSIEKLNICTSVGTYPKLGALALQLYNEDKRGLPIVGYDTVLNQSFDISGSAGRHAGFVLLPEIEFFIKPRHILISFSHR